MQPLPTARELKFVPPKTNSGRMECCCEANIEYMSTEPTKISSDARAGKEPPSQPEGLSALLRRGVCGQGTGKFAVLVAAGILFSRVAGLIRDRVFAHY